MNKNRSHLSPMRSRVLSALFFFHALFLALPAHAHDPSVATTWRLLDYIAVDYPEAVQDGVVVNQVEYDEMREFSATAADAIAALPATPASPELQRSAAGLRQAIEARAASAEIATRARELAAALVRQYPIPLRPSAPPDHEKGKVLYAQLCADCHGRTGAGDGPAGVGADPPPIDFTDRTRADERSVFALYQVIRQGLEGTTMPSYAKLPDDEAWALATYVGAIAYPQAREAAGRALLAGDATLRARLDLDRYVGTTPASLARELGSSEAEAITAYLRRHPEAAEPGTPTDRASLAVARELLDRSMTAFRNGDASKARELALAAYLDGFEPVEPLLSARDNPLMVRIEEAMARVRTGIAGNVPVEDLEAQAGELDALFAQAERTLSEEGASFVSGFVAAFTILLREGLEALLIVAAMIALLRKAERSEMLPWVHAGWSSALLAGAVTWMLATWVITISGATRELTEGFGSLIAAVVLVWVGIWMHGKSHADAWQEYVRRKLGHALGRKSGVFLLGLVFLVVYREVFETILFFAAIWNQGSKASVMVGGSAAAAALVVVGWAILRYSRRLPIARFFRYSSFLIAALAVVLVGKAVSALQEAGYLPITWWDGGFRVELIGLYPTLQGALAQAGLAALLLLGFLLSGRARDPRP